jgi:hypothetical protein
MQLQTIITNPGHVSPTAFRVLGHSDHNSGKGTIGKFRSGAKHALLVLLRHNIKFHIYSGLREIPVELRTETDSAEPYQLMYVDGKPTSMSLNFGAVDWTDPLMALRELVANALDQGQPIQAVVSMHSSAQPIDGLTQIVIDSPLGSPIFNAVSKIEETFLHYRNLENTSIISKPQQSQMRFYSKGVFVAESPVQSLFDYNDVLGKIAIDESRKFSQTHLAMTVATCVQQSSIEEIRKWFIDVLALGHQTQQFVAIEYDCNGFNFDLEARNLASTIGKELYSYRTEDAVLYNEFIPHTRVLFCQSEFHKTLIGRYLKTLEDHVNSKEYTVKPADLPATFIATAQDTFRQLETLGHTNGKPFPVIRGFTHTGTELLLGYVKDNQVYINADQLSRATLIEEFIHYCFEVADRTRQFQEITIRIIANLLK